MEEGRINEFSQIGYLTLAGLVLGESIGIPVPGSTALVAAGLLAADGKLSIVVVCLLGFGLTVIGANFAFVVGRTVGVSALTRPGPLLKHREALILRSAPIVKRFGWLAAFATRFVPGLKECGALLLGALGMTQKNFLLWNTSGALVWVLSHAAVAYYLGRTLGVSGAAVAIGVIELAAVAVVATARYLRVRKAKILPVAEHEK